MSATQYSPASTMSAEERARLDGLGMCPNHCGLLVPLIWGGGQLCPACGYCTHVDSELQKQ